MLLREGAAAVRSAVEPVTPLQVAANRLAELPGAGKPSMQPKAGPAIPSQAASSAAPPGAGRPALFQAGKRLAAGEFPTSIREKRVPDQQTCLLLTGIIPPGAIGIICWITAAHISSPAPMLFSAGRQKPLKSGYILPVLDHN